jgi:two-component system phosphate regulon response regulator PhoB
MALILIIDDEADLVDNLRYNLEREGYTTMTAGTKEAATAALQRDPVPDLVVLDLMLPDGSGTDVCRRLREDPRTNRIPVLILSARVEEIDRVVGFEIGADDYVTKPFSVRELMLRIRAVLRRTGWRQEASDVILAGGMRIVRSERQVWIDGEPIPLTSAECRLLATLAADPGRVWSRQALLDAAWGQRTTIHPRTIDVHVRRLREKLDGSGDAIETVRGVGYRFQAPHTP